MPKKETSAPSEKDLALKEKQMSKEKPSQTPQSSKSEKKQKQKGNRR